MDTEYSVRIFASGVKQNKPWIKYHSSPPNQSLKARFKRIKVFPSNLTASQNKAQEDFQEYKTLSTQKLKTHRERHLIKNCQVCREEGKFNP